MTATFDYYSVLLALVRTREGVHGFQATQLTQTIDEFCRNLWTPGPVFREAQTKPYNSLLRVICLLKYSMVIIKTLTKPIKQRILQVNNLGPPIVLLKGS